MFTFNCKHKFCNDTFNDVIFKNAASKEKVTKRQIILESLFPQLSDVVFEARPWPQGAKAIFMALAWP